MITNTDTKPANEETAEMVELEQLLRPKQDKDATASTTDGDGPGEQPA